MIAIIAFLVFGGWYKSTLRKQQSEVEIGEKTIQDAENLRNTIEEKNKDILNNF